MREILFRGKRTIDGEWVEGSLLAWPDGDADICTTSLDVDPEDSAMDKQRVDPATVEQYTGLKEKNGKRVFVGDIVRCSRGCPHEVVWLNEHGGTFIGGMPAVYLSGLRAGYAWTGCEEVIGNIHDNPELLKERGGA